MSPEIPVTLLVEAQIGRDLRFGVAASQQEAQP
jgi:hypothetical protein